MIDEAQIQEMSQKAMEVMSGGNEFARLFFYGIPFEMSLHVTHEQVKSAFETAIPEDQEYMKQALDHYEKAVEAMNVVKENILRAGGYLHETKMFRDTMQEAELNGNIVPKDH